MSKLSLSDIAVGDYLLVSHNHHPSLLGTYVVCGVSDRSINWKCVDEQGDLRADSALWDHITKNNTVSIIEEKDIQLIVDVLTKGDKHE